MTYHFAVSVSLDVRSIILDLVRQREALANGSLDSRTSRRDEVTQLVRSAHDEGSQAARAQLHQMDGDHTPSSLNAELLEESRSHDPLVADERVRVQQSSTNDGYEDDAEAPTESLGEIANGSTSADSTQVCNDLRYRHSVGGEVVLVRKHGRVEILRAVGHEVKARHQEDHVDEQDPVSLQGDLAFLDKGLADVLVDFSNAYSFVVGVRLAQTESEGDDQHWNSAAEPVTES